MEVGTTSREAKGSRNQNVCTLEVPEESNQKGRPYEEIHSIAFDERDPAKFFKIGTTLGAEHEAMLIQVLREYRDIFAWEQKDMSRVDPEVSFYGIYVDLHYKSIKQKK
ncbi:hypothetical protein LIER_13531 [Lithospermum erythrorhizon]|uniref:Uncharacterized protein n=1 Tax=Lithospermum erythrorhizon TaxID=34254 RepID=A0AAV3PZY6_LITER